MRTVLEEDRRRPRLPLTAIRLASFIGKKKRGGIF